MKREDKLFQVIARRSLSLGDAAWLKENISEKWDWPSVEERIFQEGLSALFYSHLRSLDLLSFLPGDMRKRLGRIYAETSLINRHLLKILETLEEALAERNMKVIVFKGAALLNTVYRDPALRPMEDIDLIVREEQLGVLKEILETMGFVQNGLYPYTFSKGILSVDLHRDFISSHRDRKPPGDIEYPCRGSMETGGSPQWKPIPLSAVAARRTDSPFLPPAEAPL